MARCSKAGIIVEDAHFGELDDGTVIEKHMGHADFEGKTYYFPTCTSYKMKDGKIFEVQVHNGDYPTVENYMFCGVQTQADSCTLGRLIKVEETLHGKRNSRNGSESV